MNIANSIELAKLANGDAFGQKFNENDYYQMKSAGFEIDNSNHATNTRFIEAKGKPEDAYQIMQNAQTKILQRGKNNHSRDQAALQAETDDRYDSLGLNI